LRIGFDACQYRCVSKSDEGGRFAEIAAAECWTSLAGEPLDEVQAREVAQVFKALADPARLRLLSLIASHTGGEACVCDVSAAFDLSQPTISHHLKVLRETGLITGERRGSWVYYRAVPDAMSRLAGLLTPATPALVPLDLAPAGPAPAVAPTSETGR
jgi:ArsR family transcriptional regulator